MKKSVRILASLLVAVSLLAVSATAAELIKGDTNGDIKVNNLDAANVLKYDAGINQSIENGDYNEDGVINNLDAAAILKYDAGILYTVPNARYVRYIPEEHMCEDPYAFPQTVFVIRSTEELRAYLGGQDELYDYGYELLAPEPTVPFYAYEVYNDEYFEDNILVLILVEEGSGSIRRRVTDVTKQNGSLEIGVDVLTTGWGTDDMAYWTLFIELDKSFEVTYDKVTVENKLVYVE